MKNFNRSLLISGMILILGTSYAQVEVPVFGKIQYLKGYTREISGENISYFSALPGFADVALLSRCTDGNYAVEWETEKVPANYQGKFVYFAWLAAYSKNTSHGDRQFDLYIDGRKALVFKTFKDRSIPYWSYAGEGGETLVFKYVTDDGAGDAHGYMYLKVPVTGVHKGKSLDIKIVGEKADSRDWYMTFKYEFADSLTIKPVSLLSTAGEQPLQIIASHFGKDIPLDLIVEGGKKFSFRLKDGMNSFEIYHPAVDEVTEVKITAKAGNLPARDFNVELRPVTFREIHLIHHAHYDVGYSHKQEEVERIHNRNISNALRYIENTRDLPQEARYKWNIETALAIENFLRDSSKADSLALVKAVKNGSIGIGGVYTNFMTGICQPEELFEFTSYKLKLEKEWNIKIPVAMMSDIPGLTWATLPALARAGIRYFSDGPNFMQNNPYTGDRVGFSNSNWTDRPFWWISPSGNEKILFWMAGRGYSSWHGFKAGDIGTPRGKQKISDYMDELDRNNYPYEMVQWRYNIVSDNGPTDSLISGFVNDWNRRYKSPKIILNTVEKMFAEFEERYGNSLPEFRGDFTPYWEDGAYSTAYEMGLNRRNSEKLTQLGTLYSICSPSLYDAKQFNDAWENVLLWDEHTWGAYNSISDPDIPFVTDQWKFKQHYAFKADSLIRRIESGLVSKEAALPSEVAVCNTSSWERTDVVYLDKEISKGVSSIISDDATPVIFQLLSDGRIAAKVKVAPMGITRLRLVRDGKSIEVSPKLNYNGKIENEHLIIKLNEKTGSIGSIWYKPLDVELVNSGQYSGVNEYLYVPGTDPSKSQGNGPAAIKVKESGALLTTLEISSQAPGCNSLNREVTVFNDLDRIEIRDEIDKIAVREKESVHFAFPFSIPEARERFNTGWGGIFSPGVDQLAGSNQDYYSVQHWCDVSNQRYGITLLLREACLVEPGAMIDERIGKRGMKEWKTQPDTTPTLFSYAMNNYWHTNFKADQEGKVSFSYALVPHGLFNMQLTQKEGLEFNQPLKVIPVQSIGTSASLFKVSNADMIVTSVVPAGKGLKIRVFNAGGVPGKFSLQWGSHRPQSIHVTDAAGKTFKADPADELSLPAFGIMDIETSL